MISDSIATKERGSNKAPQRVAVFGGSFNPPHLGHRAICRYLLSQHYDEVWVVPCYRHAFGKKLAAFGYRFEMCRLVFSGLPVRVLDIERRIGGVSRTVRTLQKLKKEHPQCAFSLVIGADSMKETHQWLSFPRLKALASIVAIPRRGDGSEGPFLSPLSSTRIREKVESGRSIARDTGLRVAQYISEHHLYRPASRQLTLKRVTN